MQKLQQIEDDMNQYRIKKGKKPTQRASMIIAGRIQVVSHINDNTIASLSNNIDSTWVTELVLSIDIDSTDAVIWDFFLQMNFCGQIVAPSLAYQWMMVSKTDTFQCDETSC